MKLPTIFKSAVKFVKQNDTFIMTFISVSTGVGSTLSAIGATVKANKLIQTYKEENDIQDGEPLPFKDVAKISWHLYVPTLFLSASSIACIIGSHKLNYRRQAALASMYSITETAFKEYKEKVVETLGEKKELTIREQIAQESAKKIQYNERAVIFSEYGETLFLDKWSQRYFKSDIEKVRKVQNEMNHLIFLDGDVRVNQLYEALGLPPIEYGDELGWNTDKLINMSFTASILEDNGRAYIIITHENPPFNYRSFIY